MKAYHVVHRVIIVMLICLIGTVDPLSCYDCIGSPGNCRIGSCHAAAMVTNSEGEIAENGMVDKFPACFKYISFKDGQITVRKGCTHLAKEELVDCIGGEVSVSMYGDMCFCLTSFCNDGTRPSAITRLGAFPPLFLWILVVLTFHWQLANMQSVYDAR